MSRRGKRRRISTGIYADAAGIAAVVTVNGDKVEKRYPPGTTLDTIRSWRSDQKGKLQKRALSGRAGTLAGDARDYLKRVAHLVSLKARRAELRAWIDRFGAERTRDTIAQKDVMLARSAWLKAGISAKTINNRVQTLRHLYRTLDGRKSETPCDDLANLPVEKTPAVYITPALVQNVYAELERRDTTKGVYPKKTRARFRVLATTGKRPSELMRAQPEDVDLDRRVWVTRDGKGGFSPGLYLNDDMLSAWKVFIAADAWGTFNTNSMARTLRRAGWPAGVKPYNLRHTTWLTASERGIDLSDIQQGAGHRNLATTRRHYVPVLDSRMQRMSETIDHRFTFNDSGGTQSGTAKK
jgi:integrase